MEFAGLPLEVENDVNMYDDFLFCNYRHLGFKQRVSTVDV